MIELKSPSPTDIARAFAEAFGHPFVPPQPLPDLMLTPIPGHPGLFREVSAATGEPSGRSVNIRDSREDEGDPYSRAGDLREDLVALIARQQLGRQPAALPKSRSKTRRVARESTSNDIYALRVPQTHAPLPWPPPAASPHFDAWGMKRRLGSHDG